MKPITEQNHYETLEVMSVASAEEIERAYRLAQATYDEGSLAGYSVFEEGDVDLLRERIEVAYRTLRDPEARDAYDRDLVQREVVQTPEDPEAPAPEPAAEVAAAPLEPLEAFEDVDEGGEWTGARLRRARLRQGLEIEQISKTTKVNPTYLGFIEEERFEGLPAEVYVRGFVMGFAGCLGLDGERVARSYLQRFEQRPGRHRRRLFSRL